VLTVHDAIAAIPALTRDRALAATAAAFGLPAHKIHNIVKKVRILVKQRIV
jgi:hypothetical protein